jgi:hypothetical protein
MDRPEKIIIQAILLGKSSRFGNVLLGQLFDTYIVFGFYFTFRIGLLFTDLKKSEISGF